MLHQLQQKCIARIEEAFQQAEAHYGKTIKRVPVKFSNQQSRTAGTASYQTNMLLGTVTGTGIKLSNKLLQLNPEVFVEETPGHEAAHIIAFELFGHNGTGHGRRWKEVMRVIGQDPKRLHNMVTPKGNRVEAYCDCDTHLISKQRATKMRKGYGYRCGACKTALRLGSATAKPAVKTARHVTVTAPKPTASAETVRAKAPKVSNAQLVRAYIKANYVTLAHATAEQATIVEWANSLFKTRSAARSCVIANTPKVF